MKTKLNIDLKTILFVLGGLLLFRKLKAGIGPGGFNLLNVGTIASQAEAEQVLRYLFENTDKFATGTVGEIPVEGLWFIPVSTEPRHFFSYAYVDGKWKQQESFLRVWNVAEPIEKILYTNGRILVQGEKYPAQLVPHVSTDLPSINTVSFNTIEILNPFEIQDK